MKKLQILLFFFSLLYSSSCSKKDKSVNNEYMQEERIIKRNWNITIQNEDRKYPDFPVRWYKPFHPVIPSTWFLSVDGLINEEKTFNLGDLEMFPSRRISCRMKSLEGWSIRKSWEGIHFTDFCKYLKVKPEAEYVYFYGADDYFECIKLTELLGPRVIMAYYLEDNFIPQEYGYPLVLVIPNKYSFKWIKSIIRITFSDRKKPGTLHEAEPDKYSESGDITPGTDRPLELDETKNIFGGEIIEY